MYGADADESTTNSAGFEKWRGESGASGHMTSRQDLIRDFCLASDAVRVAGGHVLKH